MYNYNLYIFDVDGTLADRNRSELLPGRTERLAQISQQIALATNQGGVGLRYWMESAGFGDPTQYPTIDEINHRLDLIAATIEESHTSRYRSTPAMLTKVSHPANGPPRLSM